MKIDLHGQAGLPYINRGVYTGSFQGMRYRLSKETREEDAKALQVVIYPEPYSFESTSEGQKEYKDFPFSKEGFDEAIAYLNEQYDAQLERWETALKNRWK